MKLNASNPAGIPQTVVEPRRMTPLVDGAATDAALLRIGAVAGIAGVVLQVAMDQMHPAHADPNDSTAAFTEYSEYGLWTAVHIGQFLGTLLLVIALLALARGISRRRGLAGALAGIGAVTAMLTAAVFAVQMAVDGVALRLAIDRWTSAAPGPEKTSAYLVAEGLRGLEKGLSGFFHLNNGLTLLALGLSITLGSLYARWLGATAVLAGLGFLIGGVVTSQTGFSSDAGRVLAPSLLLLVVFIVGSCVSMWRHAAHQPQSRS